MSHEELWLIIRLANQLVLVIHNDANVSEKIKPARLIV